jgi:hypothetical protein
MNKSSAILFLDFAVSYADGGAVGFVSAFGRVDWGGEQFKTPRDVLIQLGLHELLTQFDEQEVWAILDIVRDLATSSTLTVA